MHEIQNKYPKKIESLYRGVERYALDSFREKKIFSIFPFFIMQGVKSDFNWTGKWFSYITVLQQEHKVRYLEFDDGWSYENFWGNWNYEWVFVKVLEIKKTKK